MVSTQSLTYLWRGVSLRRTGCLTTFKCVRGSGIKGRNKSPKTINQVIRTIFCCVEQCWWCMDMWQKLHFWINFLYDREHYILFSSRILILIPKGLSDIHNMEHIIQHHLSYLCVSCKKHIAVDSAWLSVLKLSGVGGCVLFNEYTQAFGWTKHTFFKRIGLFK